MLVNDSRSIPSSAREACRQAAGHRRIAAWLAAGAHRPTYQRLPEMRAWRGHRVFVLTVTYAGGRTRQLSVRRERVAEVRRWLSNYQKLKQSIETICELNHDLLRPEPRRRRSGGQRD